MKRNTIWIIDDWQSCQMVEHLFRLSYRNCTVVSFYTESMLAAHLQEYHRGPAIILLGNLPGTHTQHQLVQALKAHSATRLTPLIMLTKTADAQYLSKAYELRANACVEKPTSTEEFIQFIALTFDYWLTCCTLPAHTAAYI